MSGARSVEPPVGPARRRPQTRGNHVSVTVRGDRFATSNEKRSSSPSRRALNCTRTSNRPKDETRSSYSPRSRGWCGGEEVLAGIRGSWNPPAPSGCPSAGSRIPHHDSCCSHLFPARMSRQAPPHSTCAARHADSHRLPSIRALPRLLRTVNKRTGYSP